MSQKLNDAIPWIGTVGLCAALIAAVYIRQGQYQEVVEEKMMVTPSEVQEDVLQLTEEVKQLRTEVMKLSE